MPVKVLVDLEMRLGKTPLKKINSGHYNGKKPWNMNPSIAYIGSFALPKNTAKSNELVSVIANIKIIDQYERQHALLPTEYYYRRAENYWELIP